jgi:hypothetical protein
MTNDSDWITVSQAAVVSGYNEEHIRRLLRDGSIAGRKFGIVWQVSHASVIAYLTNAQNSTDGRHGPKDKLPD